MLHEEKKSSEPCEDEIMLDTESASSEGCHLPNPRGLEQDRFELLSAYLDGEVTSAERKQVQEWLETDPQVQELYNRLLKLRYNLQNMEITAIQKTPDHLCQMVFDKIDQGRRKRKVLLWGGGAIAALVVGSLTSIFTGDQSPNWQFANSISPDSSEQEGELVIAINRPIINVNYQTRKVDSESLMLPLNRPPVPIPQAAMSGK